MKYGTMILGIVTICLAIGIRNHIQDIWYEEMWKERFKAEDKMYEKKSI